MNRAFGNRTLLSRGNHLVCRLICLSLSMAISLPSLAADSENKVDENDGKVLKALKTELNRSLDKLKNAGAAPLYFLAYRVIECDSIDIAAKFGALEDTAKPDRYRFAQVELRVGSPQLDNSHALTDEANSTYVESCRLPIENDEIAIRSALWRATNKAFREAQRHFAIVRSQKDLKVKESDQSDDFSLEKKEVNIEKLPKFIPNRDDWEDEVRRLSSVFNDYPFLKDSSVKLTYGREARYLVTSEGTELQDAIRSYLFHIYADTMVEDGMDLWLFERIEAFNTDTLPNEDEMRGVIKNLAERLKALRESPAAEPYAGPAILRGRAAGVFFHEILGHRLEGHRQKDENEARTFREKIGTPILPEFISVVDDPSLEKLAGKELSGTYKYDDEGVPTKPVTLVDKGILKNFLMARSPIESFSKSNGHGRCDYSHNPVARQGNLMVIADKSRQVPYAELRRMLIEEIKTQKKAYGLIFDDIAGGSTLTHIGEPQLYKLYPLVVTKVFADGRPDETIRGADIVGTPLASLELIVAAGDDTEVFNGVCGAESGWVTVSASSPSLLVKSIEVQRKQKGNDKPPLLPPPALSQVGEHAKK